MLRQVVVGLAALAAVVLFGCAGQNAAAPTSSVPPACQTNNTAAVTFENRSSSSTTYDVIWDGSRLTAIGPTIKTQPYTVAAGVPHILEFRITNTNRDACSPSTPTPAQCSSTNYWCTY